MATVPYVFECDRGAGFLANPNEHQRVGYITTLAGFATGKWFPADLTISVPYSGTPTYRGFPSSATLPGGPFPRLAEVVGIIEKFEWPGGAGDAISVDFWVSRQTATTVKAFQQSTLMTAKVDALGWWICDYDQETGRWFEQSYPGSETAITGELGPKSAPRLNVDLNGAPVKDGMDVMVYKVSLSVWPTANVVYTLRLANTVNTPTVRSWGLVSGTP